MNSLLFILEILLVVTGIAVVPTPSELRICCTREGHKGRAKG